MRCLIVFLLFVLALAGCASTHITDANRVTSNPINRNIAQAESAFEQVCSMRGGSLSKDPTFLYCSIETILNVSGVEDLNTACKAGGTQSTVSFLPLNVDSKPIIQAACPKK